MDEKRRSKRSKPVDEGYWECSVCTYRNSPEAFKCEMCDVRKGTSTRKPQLNAQLVAQQVAQQYVPPPAKKEKQAITPPPSYPIHKPLPHKPRVNSQVTPLVSTTPPLKKEKPQEKTPQDKTVIKSSKEGKEKQSSTPTSTVSASTASYKKNRPPRLKNIDRSSARSMEVTVGSVTVIITDYQLKKERRTSTDSQTNSNTNSVSHTDSLDGSSSFLKNEINGENTDTEEASS